MLPFTGVFSAFLIVNLLKGKFSHFLAVLKVPKDVIARRHEIARARSVIGNFRSISDRRLLDMVMA